MFPLPEIRVCTFSSDSGSQEPVAHIDRKIISKLVVKAWVKTAPQKDSWCLYTVQMMVKLLDLGGPEKSYISLK